MLVEKDDLTLYQLQQVDMSNYPNILTPPSSNEDSPQPLYYNPSPTCFSPSSDSNNVIISSYSANYEPNSSSNPYMRIVEQPIDRFRFRYKSEMTGTHGSLCGMNSDKSRKQTYPTIELCNFDKPAKVRCSIYQQNAKEDNMPHAHRLIKKQGKDEVDDPHNGTVSQEEGYVHVFHSMGIIHTAKKNIVPELVRKKSKLKKEEIARLEGKCRELTTKEEVEIKGLAESESKSINLNVVCLRFDAFYESNGILFPICPPIFSHGINNLKSALTGELKIVRMDHCTSPTKGGREIFILVERVTKKNIKVRFYELDDSDNILWEDYGKFSDLDVHHQYAIVFKTPPYRNLNITSSVKVYIELERPSDHARSEPKEFTYVASTDAYKPGAKRLRPNYSSSSYDSSLASEDLPATINNLCIQTATNPSLLDNADFQVNSADFQQALTNINSDEFQQVFDHFWPDYHSVTTDAPVVKYGNNAADRSKLAFGFPASQTATNNKDWATNTRTKSVVQRYISPEETKVAKTALEELRNFIKTKPTEERVIVMLHHYLSQNNKTNALHISVKQNDVKAVLFLLKLVHVWKQHQLLNVKSDEGETALHIATYCDNEEIIGILMPCKADVSVSDSELNTAVHIGVMSNASSEILEKLLSLDNVADYIDNENNDGNTALNLAIENNNLRALKILCSRGADINKRHKKSGFTPMRFAVEKQHVEILKYVLQHPEIDPLVADFQGTSPLAAAMKKDAEVAELVSEYMRNNDYTEVEIKNEIEDLSEDEIEEKFSVKMEQIAQEDLRDMYSTVTIFTPDCLSQVAKILDESGNWQSLAELLDLGHLMRSDLYDAKSSPSKFLLKLAVEVNGDTVMQIRDFLENLDENLAVEIIDNMVKSQFL